MIHTALTRIESLRHSPVARGWAKALRWFLGIIFIWPGVEKMMGKFFIRALDEPGILPFFQALHDADLYWRFIGVGQVVAGVLLLFARTAHWGVFLSVPIYANIVAIIWALPFDVATQVAGTLFFALNLLLVLWYAPELDAVLRPSPASSGSMREAWIGSWRRSWFRWLVAFLVAGWLTLHVLDRMNIIGHGAG